MQVLVLGGVGFIGRNLVKYLVDQGNCSKIRVVDKVLPPTAFLGAEHQAAFDNNIVDYMQANLTAPAAIKKAFTHEVEGKFNIVFNLAAETKYGQTEAVYEEKVLDLARKCAAEAVECGVDKFIQVSTAQVYEPKKDPSKEDGKLNPWTNLAKYSLQAEEALKATDKLPLIIVRPCVVYGPGDVTGLAPRIIVGAVYKHLGEKMKLLWGADLKISTVHVRDVCAALWTISEKADVGTTWNLADKTGSTQGSINKFLETIFGIKTGFQGAAISQVAKLKLKDVTEAVNDKHLKPWSELCKNADIVNTPLTPYLDQELLYNNHLSVDGSSVESLGFSYQHPQVTEELMREEIEYYVNQNLFPSL